MTQIPRKIGFDAHRIGWLLRYVAIPLLTLAAVGLFLTHFKSFGLFIGALPLSWLIVKAQKHINLKKRRWRLLLLFLLLFLLCGTLFYLSFVFFSWPNVPARYVSHYSVSVKLLDNGNFRIVERAKITDTPGDINDEPTFIEVPPSTKEISGTKIGLVMSEVTIAPLGLDKTGSVNITVPDNTPFRVPFCGYNCPETEVELIDFPKNFFYEAKNAEDLNSLPYLKTETIQWHVSHPDRGISFAYNPYPSPINILTPLLQTVNGIYFGESNPFLFLLLICCIFVPVLLFKDLPHINLHFGKKIFGDNVEGDQIAVGNISDSTNIAIGRNASAISDIAEMDSSLRNNEEQEEK